MGMSRYDIALGKEPPPEPESEELQRLPELERTLIIGGRRSGKTQTLIQNMVSLIDRGIPQESKIILCGPHTQGIEETANRLTRMRPLPRQALKVIKSYRQTDLVGLGDRNTIGIFCEEIQECSPDRFRTGLEQMLEFLSRHGQGQVAATCDTGRFLELTRGRTPPPIGGLEEFVRNIWLGRHNPRVPTYAPFSYFGVEWMATYLPNIALISV